MELNPYSPTTDTNDASSLRPVVHQYRFMVAVLVILTVLVAWRIFPMFISFTRWPVTATHWTFLFTPVFYFFIASIVGCVIEYRPAPRFFRVLPLLLLPSIPFSAIILYRLFDSISRSDTGDLSVYGMYNLCVLGGTALLFPLYLWVASVRAMGIAATSGG